MRKQKETRKSKSTKRVAYLTNMLLDWETQQPRFGGGEYYCLTLGSLLRDLGFEVTFYQAGNTAFEGDYYGFRVVAIPPGAQVSEFQVGICDEFYRITQDYDHVIHNIPTYASGMLREDALVICHSVWFDHDNYKPPIEFRTSEWFEQLYRAFSRPRRIVSVDTNVISVIRALWPELAGRMTYIPSFVDTDIFSPPARRDHEKLTVLFPRRSEYTRGSRLLEPILKGVPHDCRFLWVGDGEPEETARIKALAESDSRLQFFAASFEEMPRFYKEADICVIPAVASEGTCLASLEALASGCAVVCTNVGGLANIFQPDVNALMTDVDPEQLGAAINRLIEDPDERARIQKIGPQTARFFNLDMWRKRWIELLQELGWVDRTKQKRMMTTKRVSSKHQGSYESLTINPDISPEDVAYILEYKPTLDTVKRADVICFSIIDWEFRYQRPQQMMSQFASHGHRVFYIRITQFNPPGAEPRVTVTAIKENIFEVTLTADGQPNIYSDVITGAHLDELIAALDELRRQYGIAEALSYVMIASWGDVAIKARERWGWQVLYDCMDEWEGFPNIGRSLIEMEARLIAASDLTVTTAQRLYDKWNKRGRRVVLARNGVDYEFYRQQLRSNALLSKAKHPVIGYYGAIAAWFDLDLMYDVAAGRPEYTFVLIGGVFDVDVSRLEALPNVRFLGQQPYEQMPKYLYHFDACMIPFQINHITEATDPVKLYEYLSGGKPVVSVALPEIERFQDLLYIARGPDDFVAKLDQAVKENDPDMVKRRKRFAAKQTWNIRYLEIIDGLTAVAGTSIITVTRNDLAYTKLCLESLLRNTGYPSYEIIVVDNASDEVTLAYLRYLAHEFPHIKLVENGVDEGFVRALNRGTEHATAEYMVLVKPDTIFPKAWLSRLIRNLRDTRVGLCCPVTNYLGSETGDDAPYHSLAQMTEHISGRPDMPESRQLRRLTLFCAGLRREVFNQVGPLDARTGEDGYEDDYATRVRAQGYEVINALDVFVHYFGKTANEAHNKLSEREHRIRALQTQLSAVETARAALAAITAELRRATTSLTSDLRNAQLKGDIFAKQIQTLDRRLVEKELLIQALSEQASQQQQVIKSVSQQVNEQQQVIQSVSQQADEQQQVIQSLSQQVNEQQQVIQSASQQANEQQQVIQSLSQRANEQQQVIQSLSPLTETVEKLSLDLDVKRHLIAAREGLATYLEDQNASLRDQLAELSRQQVKTEQSLRDQLGELSGQQIQTEQSLQTTEQSLQTTVAELTETQKALADSQAHLEELSRQQVQTEQSLHTTEQSLQTTEQSLQTTVAELTETQNALSDSQAHLERITQSFGWRLLSLYGPIKYRYLLPFFRMTHLIPPSQKDESKDQK
jgi:glycosyltransferase involved in cell wall biosynthesis/GT2 family glycosyltransferase